MIIWEKYETDNGFLFILKVGGGWLVKFKDNLIFIPDPEHQHKPAPVKN
jgi:hypothetical protein